MQHSFAVINGPNLNWLGKREPKVYGAKSWDQIAGQLENWARATESKLSFFQSNSEGALIDHLQSVSNQVAGIVFNPGAYAHTSIALRDCVAMLPVPVVEVHLTPIHQRESFRRHSYLMDVSEAYIAGFGEIGYWLALELLKYLKHERSQQR